MAAPMLGKVSFVVRETGNLFAISLEGFRRTWDVKNWWQEYLRQCWFIAKVTSIPVMLISIPFGMVIALHVGSFSKQLGAESATGAAMVPPAAELPNGAFELRPNRTPSVISFT